MVFVFSEGYALGAPSYTTRPDANKPETVNLIGFLTSLAAGATAFGQLQRNDELTRSYALAAQELLLIKSLLNGCNDESDFEELVKSSSMKGADLVKPLPSS